METFQTSLSDSALVGKITMNLIKTIVRNEEMREKPQGSSSQSEVLIIDIRYKS